MNLKKKTLGFCYFTLGNFDQSKASIPQNCVIVLLENFKLQGQNPSTHANSAWVFFDPLKFYSFCNEWTSTPDPHIIEDSFWAVSFTTLLSRKTKQPLAIISSSKKRRYLTEKPKKSVASAEASNDELEEGQDKEQEVIHVTMK